MKYIFLSSLVFFSEYVIKPQSQNILLQAQIAAEGCYAPVRHMLSSVPECASSSGGLRRKTSFRQRKRSRLPSCDGLLRWLAKRDLLGCWLDVLIVAAVWIFLTNDFYLQVFPLMLILFLLLLLWSKCKLTPKPWVLRLKAPLLFEMLYFTHRSILQILSREIVCCLWI